MKKFLCSLLITILILLSSISSPSEDIYSQSSCPPSMTLNARYDCLQKELQDLNKNQSNLQNQLKEEDYKQLTLREQIDYITNQIDHNEAVIQRLHLEILSQDIEINILTRDIQETENSISIHKQEIELLEELVNKRIEQSYKYSFVGTLDLFADSKNLNSILRKTKYILETRERDKETLQEFSTKKTQLELQEDLLVDKRIKLQHKRNSFEENKEKLLVEKKNLDQQKTEQNTLLVASEQKEKEYRAQLDSISASIAEADEIVSDLIIQLFNQGALKNGTKVSTGHVIGYQGHTGCSFGSHLHFEVRNRAGVRLNPGNFLNGGTVWRSVTSRVYRTPIDGAVLTQGFKSNHRGWDMVSMTQGDQSGRTYKVPRNICPPVERHIRNNGRDWAFLTGEGAPIRAITNGTVYFGTDRYGGKYALLHHSDGNTSLYLHLR
jgi:peptidoglycan hydrolase CwlO-like protein